MAMGFGGAPPDTGQMRDPAWWRAFAPELHIEDRTVLAGCQAFPVAEDAARSVAASVAREGYFQRDPPDWGLPIAAMAAVIGELNRRSLPPVFAFHFDEFWLLFSRMYKVIAAVLGEEFIMLPHFWAWHVDPAAGGSGWAPHRDNGRVALDPDGTPKSLSVWLPLTDATPLNGCMYLVPADRDPTYNTADEQKLLFQLSDIRALPAVAGSMLAWTKAVIHWGARSAPPAPGRPTTPRISVSCEFQRADTPAPDAIALDPRAPPGFALRQQLIGGGMLRYRHMHELTPDLERFATALAAQATREAIRSR